MAAQNRSAREQQRDDTRARLFAAAAELLLERGYQATTIAEIASRAGVAKGTFFVHFPSKDAIVLELVKMQCGGAKKARTRAIAAGASPIEALRVTAMELGIRAGVSRNISRAVLAATLVDERVGDAVSAVFDEVHAEMLADAREAKRRGLLGHGVDPETLAGQLMVSYLGSALYFSSNPRAQPLAEVLAMLVDSGLSVASKSNLQSVNSKEKGHDSGSTNPGSRARSGRRRP